MNGLVLLSATIVGGLFLWTVAFDDAAGAAFAKYDGIDGESKDTSHDKWIDVLSVDWGVHKPSGGDTGQSRRRGAAVVEDMTLTIEYEKAAPKLLESALQGRVIPMLEIELTKIPGMCSIGIPPTDDQICREVGDPVVYLRYEMKNVQVTSYSISGTALDEDVIPTVVVGNNFEEIKVTYTEYDDEDGSEKGNVETTWKVEEGTK